MENYSLPLHFTPYEPRRSATLLLLRDDPFQVLTVTRNAKSYFSSAIVFPGGMVEDTDSAAGWCSYASGHTGLQADERALRIAACRETWEETSIAAASKVPAPMGALLPIEPFQKHLHATGSRLDLSAVVPFARWITPPEMERRYDTHMFVAQAPDNIAALCDGDEIVSCEWLEPHKAVARAHAGDPAILFSTYFNMSLLALAQNTQTAIAMALDRPLVPVIPRKVDDSHGSWIKIDDGAGYPVTRAAIPAHHPINNAT